MRLSATRWLRGPALALVILSMAAAPVTAVPQEDEPQEREPEPIEETITVTATRLPTQITDVPAAVETITGELLRQLPALGLDEALGWLPEASLFRRSPARAAHPTAQGLNLRGLAPSGTSRALVLADGVPITDPFGGWVYWDRVPAIAVERIEVALGGGSAPFGSQALGGVVQIVTRTPVTRGFRGRLRALVGEDATRRLGVSLSGRLGTVEGLLAVEAFDTDGYFDVAAGDRGAVDRPVASRHLSARLRLALDDRTDAFVEGLLEDRDNGTVLQTNDTRALGASIRRDGRLAGGRWQATAFARRQVFESRFSAVSDSRDAEIPVLEQRVPSTELGGSFLAVLDPRPLDALSIGADVRHVDGRSEERVVLAGVRREPGGRQLLGGAFATAAATPGSWRLDLSLRADAWRNAPDRLDEPTRSAAFVSPRLGVLWRPDGPWAVRAAAYRAFRAPTLNELYRQFRVGDVVTRENPELREERLTGAEVGVDWRGALGSGDVSVSATGYLNDLDDAVVNATVGTGSGLILRQRRNVGSARVMGLELDAGARIGPWGLDASVSWIDAEIRGGHSGSPGIAGNRLPQAPDYRARASVSYRAEGWRALLAVHAVGEQFEDDLEELPLAPGATVDLALDWRISDEISLGLRGQNLLDERLQVGRVPLLTLGPPRTLSALASLRLGGR